MKVYNCYVFELLSLQESICKIINPNYKYPIFFSFVHFIHRKRKMRKIFIGIYHKFLKRFFQNLWIKNINTRNDFFFVFNNFIPPPLYVREGTKIYPRICHTLKDNFHNLLNLEYKYVSSFFFQYLMNVAPPPQREIIHT